MTRSLFCALFLFTTLSAQEVPPVSGAASSVAPATPQTPPATPEAAPGPPPSAKEIAWDLLTRGLQEKDPEKRKLAILALGSVGPAPEVLKLLNEAQKDRDPEIRVAVMQAYGLMKSTYAIPSLRSALEDVPEVAFVAAKMLWDIGDRTGRDVFQEIMTGEKKETPGAIQGAIRDAKKKMRSPTGLLMIGVKEASGAFLGPASMGINFAQEAMKDSAAPGRIVAADFLSQDPDPYALTLLEWALQDNSWFVRAAAAKALGVRGTESTIAKLEPLLYDKKEGVTYMAAASIVHLSITKSAPPSPENKSGTK